MSHCKDCKYWELETWPTEKPNEVNRCAYPKQLWNASEWVELEDVDEFGRDGIRVINELNKNTLAFVQDGSDYKANLYTRAEFGCVVFVEKQQ